MHAHRRRSAGLGADKRGATTIVFAAGAVAMLAVAGLAVDSGNITAARRRLQGTTDLAAIAAATSLSTATQAADANAIANAYTNQDVSNVELGIYTADPSIPPQQRFQPAPGAVANAARITMTHQQPIYFGQVFALAGGNTGPAQTSVAVTTQGIAVSRNVADFSIGTTVASFNGGIVNAILGAAVGGSVSLSAVDYTSLATANVDLFAFARALSLQEGLVGATYAKAFAGTVPMEEFVAALIAAAPSAASALNQLLSQAQQNNATVDLSKLVDFGPYANLSLSDPEPNVTATASALSLLQAAAQLGGAAHLISLNIAANIPGISSVTALMTLGEPAQASTLIAVDSAGSTVHTAQIRLFLQIGLVGTPPASVVNLPIYLEVGTGTAQLAGISCNPLDGTSTTATLNVTPGLVNGWIGNVTAAQMLNYSTEPTVTAGTLVNLGLVTVTGRANAQVGDTAATQVQFNYADIQSHTVKSSDTKDFVASLLQGLFVNTQLQVTGIPVPGLPQAVMSVLSGASAPLDQLINAILQTAGVNLGQASTWMNGARCGPALLAG